jgi:hypothetical protein
MPDTENYLSVWWQTYDSTDIYHEFIPCQCDDKHMTLQIYTMNSFPVSVMTNIWHYRYIPWIHSPSVRWQTYDITDIYHEFIPCQWDDKHIMTVQIYTMNSFPVSEKTNIWHYRYIPWIHSISEMTNIWHYRYIPWIHSLSVRWQTYDITDMSKNMVFELLVSFGIQMVKY